VEKLEPNAVVTLRNQVSPWLMVLQVSPDGWVFPPFLPGQVTTLGVFGSAPRSPLSDLEMPPPDPSRLIRRAYSIASSPVNREYLEFYVNLVPGGVLSPRLFALDIGDRVWLSPKVVGAFTFEHVPQDADVVLIANGSGLAPYLSMLTTHLELVDQRRVALVHGVRHSWDLGYRSVFLAMQHLRKNFTYVPVVSRPQQEPVPWKGAVGHVQEAFAAGGALDRAWGFHPSPERTHVFLCGSPLMIEETTALLLAEGFRQGTRSTPGTIHTESYWTLEAERRHGARD
jgi:ferredoxin--NADP+ reductase